MLTNLSNVLDSLPNDLSESASKAAILLREYVKHGRVEDRTAAVDALSLLSSYVDITDAEAEISSTSLIEKSPIYSSATLNEAVEGSNGMSWNASLIRAGNSLNRKFYSPELLQASVDKFEGVKCYADHPSASEEMDRPERSVRDLIGWFEGAHWNPQSGTIDATFVALPESPVVGIIKGAFERGRPDLIGLSIRGSGSASVRNMGSESVYVVDSIEKIFSVDLVTEPAAGGKFLSLHESAALDMYDHWDEAVWSTAYINDLPDSSFLYIENGGEKDEDGKTVPRSLRHFPYKDGEGNVDLAHVRNAIARIPQSNAPGLTEEMKNSLQEKARKILQDMTDSSEDKEEEVSESIDTNDVDAGDNNNDSDGFDERMEENTVSDNDVKVEEAVEEIKEEVLPPKKSPEPKVDFPSVAVVVEEDAVKGLREEIEKMKCANLLERKLEKSGLPGVITERIRKNFADKVFSESALDEAISDERKVYAAVLEEARPTLQVRTGLVEVDKYQKALDGLLMRETVDGITPFRSLHEAYCKFNGVSSWDLTKDQIADGIMSGIKVSPTPMREALTWSTAIGNTLHRMLIQEYMLPELNEWRMLTNDIRDLSDMKNVNIQRLGYYNTLPSVSAGGTYTEPASPSEEQAVITPGKFGRLESYTWEMALNDDIGALRVIPGRLAMAAKLTLHKTIFDMFDDNQTTTYDNTAWFHADHDNKGSAALSVGAMSTAIASMRSQSALSASELMLSVKPKYLLVGPTLEPTAKQIRDGNFYLDTNYYNNPWKEEFEVMVIDYWTTNTTYWYLVADPRMVPTFAVGFLNGQDAPSIFTEAVNSGSSFTADKIYFKVRFVFGVTPTDHRGVYGYLG